MEIYSLVFTIACFPVSRSYMVTVPAGRRRRKAFCRGFTLVELVIVMAIVATLAAIAAPVFTDTIEKARITRTIEEVRGLEKVIVAYYLSDGAYPETLADAEWGNLLDPWGNPYQYLKIAGNKGRGGNMRKDRFLVPLNTDFDLYSMGKDGQSRSPLTARVSLDDIIRANDGGYVGLAAEY